jgi:hypothetical protein
MKLLLEHEYDRLVERAKVAEQAFANTIATGLSDHADFVDTEPNDGVSHGNG